VISAVIEREAETRIIMALTISTRMESQRLTLTEGRYLLRQSGKAAIKVNL
jgi:hypothetical protein